MITIITLTKSEIFTIYNYMRAAARRAVNIKKIERLNKALDITQSKAHYMGERTGYYPSIQSSKCKDWVFHNAHKRAYTEPC